jgi:formate hydrogenlyase subunit 3/multisubunit Na+/H+ antiporter MnhD subunit
MKVWIEAIGWSGALLILAAYGLISGGKVEARSPLYQMMNIVGAAGLIVNSGWNGALPSVGLNVVWLCIGLYTLLRRRRADKKGNERGT